MSEAWCVLSYWPSAGGGSAGGDYSDIVHNDLGSMGAIAVTVSKGQDFQSTRCGDWKKVGRLGFRPASRRRALWGDHPPPHLFLWGADVLWGSDLVAGPQPNRPAGRDGLRSHLVNVWWRTLLTILRAKTMLRRNGPVSPTSVGRIRLRTLPTDIDLLGHMNNGRYGSLFDLGRFDLLIRTGMWDLIDEKKWYAVVASETITFRKSLQLWQRFTVETRLAGHDEKSVYMIHRAVVKGEIYAEMLVRARFLRRAGGTVPLEELFEALHRPDDLPPLEPWVREWAAASALPSTKEPAPSVWD